jgi:hypothetical protein
MAFRIDAGARRVLASMAVFISLPVTMLLLVAAGNVALVLATLVVTLLCYWWQLRRGNLFQADNSGRAGRGDSSAWDSPGLQ